MADSCAVHLMIFRYMKEYYPRLCFGSQKIESTDDPPVLDVSCELTGSQTVKDVFENLKDQLIAQAESRGENIEAIRTVISWMERNLG